MAWEGELYLHEEVLLLALKDDEGTVEGKASMYGYAIGGALLAELLLHKRIAIDEGKRKLVSIVSDEPVGDAVIDECLGKICGAKRRGSAQTWVSKFAGVKRLKHRVAEGLCVRGVLRMDVGKVLFLFERKVYPEVDAGPERELIGRLGEAIFTDISEVDVRTVVMVSLARNTGLLNVIFDKKKLKGRKKRIEQIANGDVAGKAAAEAIAAMQAAIMVVCIMPTITS
ncbi:MAG: GPP34 family phosphoprotein [Anaerohalosphaera sp.]|nr:GPP34 family phosphoprotein [Anaerohalosphaera sp.]